eukprot:CAMPEP_0118980178 /NCGR_PEP_ID=MMETSP1173-20130426/27715_1 /TAXON_ID=1034831 /ORGANISM="Rhizochromulina marina cf, Strain CCMP1243" /LENGTH=322 /DNA_ID=CAMNT_0006930503 /DNA_START=1 /DNA_END=969 /DNA_ORIENTATION=+
MEGQSVEQRRKLRKAQRDLREKILDAADDIGDADSEAFQDFRLKNNQLEEKAMYMRESVLDLQNFKTITTASTQQAQALAMINQKVSVDRLIESLRSKGVDDEGAFQWASLGASVSKFFATVPGIEFMQGPLGRPEPLRKTRAQAKGAGESDEEEEAEAVKVETIANRKDDEIECTQKRISHLSSKLVKDSAETPDLDFFQYLVDPQSFTQTVENIFDFSFLVKKGSASLAVQDGVPVISSVSEAANGNVDEDKPSRQLVISLSPGDLRELREVFECAGDGVAHRDEPSYDPNFLGATLTTTSASSSSSRKSSSSSSKKRKQ